MNCPFCCKEMEKGYLKGSPNRVYDGSLYWDYESKMKMPAMKINLPELAVSHYDHHFPSILAYKCDECKKIILDTYIVE